jgi:aryl-alcohol dehydrogenase-like predicted oxidoreductase
MEYRRLGSTGLRVSRAILGCGNFGGVGSAAGQWGRGSDKETAFEILDQAYELGINCVDTADAYGGGLSERFVGEWLRARGPAVREGMLVATKVGQPVGDGPDDRGLSRRHVMRQVEHSLKTLRVEAIDMYLIHHPDPNTPLEETLGALDDAVRQGKVRYLGACNMPAWLMAKALGVSSANGWHRFQWAQQAYNLLQREDEREFLPLVQVDQLGYTPHSPLAGGWLTGKYAAGAEYPRDSRMAQRPELYRFVEDSLHERLARLAAHAQQRGCSTGALALAWVMAHALVTAPIVGPRRREHLGLLAEALDISLDEGERRAIGDLMAAAPASPALAEAMTRS